MSMHKIIDDAEKLKEFIKMVNDESNTELATANHFGVRVSTIQSLKNNLRKQGVFILKKMKGYRHIDWKKIVEGL